MKLVKVPATFSSLLLAASSEIRPLALFPLASAGLGVLRDTGSPVFGCGSNGSGRPGALTVVRTASLLFSAGIEAPAAGEARLFAEEGTAICAVETRFSRHLKTTFHQPGR
jgi:hypothetical protein